MDFVAWLSWDASPEKKLMALMWIDLIDKNGAEVLINAVWERKMLLFRRFPIRGVSPQVTAVKSKPGTH